MIELLVLLLKLMLVAAAVIVVSLVLHELGHLICGLIGGYSLVYIEFFGLVFWGGNATGKKRYVRGLSAGQCVMERKDGRSSAKSRLIIKGGCISNCVLCIMGFIASVWLIVSGKYADVDIAWLCSGILLCITNFALYVHNWFGKSVTNDGNTYRLVASDARQFRLYANICRIAGMLAEGKSYGWILENAEEGIFEAGKGLEGSLAEELKLYRFYALLENDICGNKAQAAAGEFLRKLDKGTCYFEKDAGCAVATYLLCMCKKGEPVGTKQIRAYLGYLEGLEPAREALQRSVSCVYKDAAVSLLIEPKTGTLDEEESEIIKLEKRILLTGDYVSYKNTLNSILKI